MRFLALVAIAACAAGCDTSGDGPLASDAAAKAMADARPDARLVDAEDVFWVPPQPAPSGDPPPGDAGDPPTIVCGPDAGDEAGSCAKVPPSQCVSSSWLVYYVGPGACVGGRCVWEKQFISCGCVRDHCCPPYTAGCF